MHRRNLNELSIPERKELSQLIKEFIDTHPEVIEMHANTHAFLHSGANGLYFLSFHRNLLGIIEKWMNDEKGKPQFVPLPRWRADLNKEIPKEFFAKEIVNMNPSLGGRFSGFIHERLGDFSDDQSLGQAVKFRLDVPAHIAIFGPDDPRYSFKFPIAWCWHALLDDIWTEFQQQTLVVPNCIGLFLNDARQMLSSFGLGNSVAIIPHFHAPNIHTHRETHWHQEWWGSWPHPHTNLHDHGTPSHDHRIIAQYPLPHSRVHHGAIVSLTAS